MRRHCKILWYRCKHSAVNLAVSLFGRRHRDLDLSYLYYRNAKRAKVLGGLEMSKKKEKRFGIKEEQSLGLSGLTIIVDTKTGVNYIAGSGFSLTGITPLLDENGKVVIDGKENE